MREPKKFHKLLGISRSVHATWGTVSYFCLLPSTHFLQGRVVDICACNQFSAASAQPVKHVQWTSGETTAVM